MDNSNNNQLPEQLEDNILRILNSKPVETISKSIANAIIKFSENDSKRLELEKQRLEIENKKIEIESKEIEAESKQVEMNTSLKQQEMRLVKYLDISNKAYAILSILVAGLLLYIFESMNVLDKSTVQNIVIMLLTILIAGGFSVMKSLLEKKNQ